MKSIKKGRGPSIMGGVVALLMAVLGIVWSVGASKIGSSPFGGGGFNMEGSPFSFSGGTGTIFTVFGVVFTLVCVVMAIYEFTNATRPNRFSEIDIVDGHEEQDPLNAYFGEKLVKDDSDREKSPAKEEKFCPACGAKMAKSYEYCPSCGEQQPEVK